MSGVFTGLIADVMAGGLTLGTGALVGGVLGATGGAMLAKGYNVVSNKDKKVVGWSPGAMTEAFEKSLLLYLAVAHFGRGQGQWRPKEAPAAWRNSAQLAIHRYNERLQSLWRNISNDPKSASAQIDCTQLVHQAIRDVLLDIHPEFNPLELENSRSATRLR